MWDRKLSEGVHVFLEGFALRSIWYTSVLVTKTAKGDGEILEGGGEGDLEYAYNGTNSTVVAHSCERYH